MGRVITMDKRKTIIVKVLLTIWGIVGLGISVYLELGGLWPSIIAAGPMSFYWFFVMEETK